MSAVQSAGVESPAQTSSEPLLEVSGLSVRFAQRSGVFTAVENLSYELRVGETLAVIGESGSGKTVSSRAIIGLLPASAQVTGSARLSGNELLGLKEREHRKYLRSSFGMIFQDPGRALNPTMKIGAQLTEAIRLHAPTPRRVARERAVQLLNLVRLPDAAAQLDQYPHQLSGGMRQRVVIAIALASEPKVLFADEATSSLDVTTQARIMDLLVELQRELGMAIVLISHNLALAAQYANSLLVMYSGRAVEYGPIHVLVEGVKMRYTRLLLDAVPNLHGETRRRAGEEPVKLPASSGHSRGCAFAPRCPSASSECWEVVPDWATARDGHRYACLHPCQEEVHP